MKKALIIGLLAVMFTSGVGCTNMSKTQRRRTWRAWRCGHSCHFRWCCRMGRSCWRWYRRFGRRYCRPRTEQGKQLVAARLSGAVFNTKGRYMVCSPSSGQVKKAKANNQAASFFRNSIGESWPSFFEIFPRCKNVYALLAGQWFPTDCTNVSL